MPRIFSTSRAETSGAKASSKAICLARARAIFARFLSSERKPETIPSTVSADIVISGSLMPWASRCLGSRWSSAMRTFSSTR